MTQRTQISRHPLKKLALIIGGVTLAVAVPGGLYGLYWHFWGPVPPSLNFELKKQIYAVGEDVSLKDARFCDKNGTENLDKIQFRIEKSGKDWKYLNEIKKEEIKKESLSSSIDKKHDSCVNFSLSAKELLKSLPLTAGDYLMKVIGFDKSKKQSKPDFGKFRINAEPTKLQFSTNKKTYKEKEAVVLKKTKVCDDNGFDDIAKVQFRIKRYGSSWKDRGDAKPTDNGDKNCASFSYEMHNLAPGSYQLEGIAYDVPEFKSKPHTVEFIVNAAPRKLRFSTDTSSYKVGSTIGITGTSVCDDDGIRDIKKVEFRIRKENGREVDKYSQSLTSYSNSTCTSFNHKRKLSLNLGPGSYKLSATAYDSLAQRSNSVTHNFKINHRPRDLSVSEPSSNTASSTINITGEVCDDDGIRDIDKVEFKLSGNSFRKQSTTVKRDNGNCGSFSHQLSSLLPGSYKLSATAYDKLGEQINTETPYFKVDNAAPRNLSVVGDRSSYRAGSTIKMTGKVCDDNGTDHLKKVSFWLKKDSDNDWQNLPEITSFTPESRDSSCASFTFRYNSPSDLSPGQYILYARAYDRSDENINKQIKFMVVQ